MRKLLRLFLSLFAVTKKHHNLCLTRHSMCRRLVYSIFIGATQCAYIFDANAAAYATGGSSRYLNTVLWLTWGDGTNGTNNTPLYEGSSTSAEIQVTKSLKLTVNCSLSNLQGRPLRSYRPGSFYGDSLDLLYNIGGTGSNNQLINGIATTGGTAQFTVTCLATLGNMPYRLKGLVMADAESLAVWNGSEFTRASANGNWNVVEMRKNNTNGEYYAQKSQDGQTQTIAFGPGTDNKTAAVTFLTFNQSAYGDNDQVSMDFAFKGGGVQAIAIGLLAPYGDYGDAPESYGNAIHLVNNTELTDDGVAVGSTVNLNDPAYVPGELLPPSINYIGSRGPDTEIVSPHSDDALDDDNTPNPGSNEEDGWPSAYTLSVFQAGKSLSQSVACNGSGAVAGWIDFDRNGTFDASERAIARCQSGTAALKWPKLPALTAGRSYVRLRYSTNTSQLQSPVDYAENGEVEDHMITVIAPDLALSKSSNSQDGHWRVGDQKASYTLTVTNKGPVATGNGSSQKGELITVLDELPTGIHPRWNGTWTDQGWSCTAANQRVTCRTTKIIAATGQSGDTSTFNLPVKVGSDAIGTATNNASVGGGMDPHNNGQPPEPNSQCNDSHCAHHSIDVPQPSVHYHKSASSQGPVSVGDTVLYTLSVHVANGMTTDTLSLADPLDDGLDLRSIEAKAPLKCQAAKPMTCTLPAGTAEGDYTVNYTTTVNSQASQQIRNAVTASGKDSPSCDGTCQIDIPVTAAAVSYHKQRDVQGPVGVNDTITYTLTVQVDHSKTIDDVQLTDTFDQGLTFDTLVRSDPLTCQAGNPLHCTLAKGTAPGQYQVVYRAKVNGQATQSVKNQVSASGDGQPQCNGQCTVTNEVKPSRISYSKKSQTSGPVAVGDTINFSLHASVLDSKTTSDLLLTDTAQAGLEFLSVQDSGPFQCNSDSPLRCTLPAGTQPGDYDVHYSARVTAAASGRVENQVDGQGGDQPECASPSACHVAIPVAPAQVRFHKQALTQGPVNVGDTVRYQLIISVSQSQTTEDVRFSDQLGSGLNFDTVTDSDRLTCTQTNPLQCTLPARTPPGEYNVFYQAKVNAKANGSVSNQVSGEGGTGPKCDASCSTSTKVNPPSIRYAKQADHQGTVAVGDLLSYSLIAEVSQAQTTSDLILTDQLGEGLRFEQFVDAKAMRCSGTQPVQCILPAGSAPGRYAISYTARVTDQAKGHVRNAVNGQGGGPDTQCGDQCAIEHPLQPPSVHYSKSSDAHGPVKVGDAITYLLTIQVSHSQTTQALTLTDQLGAGLTFETMVDSGQLSCRYEAKLECTLPSATVPGTYQVSYRARVNAQAIDNVTNAVTASGGDDNGCEGSCTTNTAVEPSAVSYHKSVDSTGPVAVGDTLHYTLTINVAHSQTREDIGLTDTFATGLTFARLIDVQGLVCDTGGALHCTLPAGTVPGTYHVTYAATVNDQATKQVRNSVQSDGRGNAHCDDHCTTATAVADSAVYYNKTTQTAGPVAVGDTVLFTLTTEVKQSQTTQEVTLTDQLGSGLAFDRITDAGAYQCNAGNPLRCTLPAGSVPGTYPIHYSAIVTSEAKDTVHNAVTGSGGDGPHCDSHCGVDIDVAPPQVRYHKTSDDAKPVAVGDTITYTLSVDVGRSQTTTDVVITDQMATGLDFGTLIDSGQLQCTGANPFRCTLPKGTLPGRYTVRYTAIVNAQALGTVHNGVTASGLPDLACDGSCQVETPVQPAQVGYRKQVIDAPATVSVGQILTYAIETVVSHSQTTEDVTLTDQPDPGLELQALTDQGAYQCTLGQTLHCTLAKGTRPGTYRLQYTARVLASAREAVTNRLTNSGGHAECSADCSVRIPVTPSETVYSKSVATTDAVVVGDTLRYTLTATIAHSQSTRPLELTDTLGPGLDFASLISQNGFHCSPGNPLHCDLPAATPPGTYTVTYTATVNDTASGQVKNAVTQSENSAGSCNDNCTTTTPVKDTAVRYHKHVDGPSPAAVGDRLHYTLTTVIGQSKITQPFVLTDTLGDGLEFDQLDDSGAYTCTTGQQLVCTLAKDTAPGSYSLHYTAKVTTQASGKVHNGVTAAGITNAECTDSCAVDTPVANSLVRYSKTSDTKDPVDVGQTITYTLNVDVSQSRTTEATTIADTLGQGLRLGKVIQAEGLTCQNSDGLQCILPAQTIPGRYRVVYTATVDDSAQTAVTNQVVGRNPAGGDPDPQCDTCVVTIPVRKSDVQLRKQAIPAAGANVHAGDVISYTVTVDILHSAATLPIELVDTMEGQDIKAIGSSDHFQCTAQLVCTLAAGTPPGHYELTYQTTVAISDLKQIGNSIKGRVGPHPLKECNRCTVQHVLADPHVQVHKESSIRADTEVEVGQDIQYSLVADISNGALLKPLVLTDTPDASLAINTVPSGCQVHGHELICTLPSGTPPGIYRFDYRATVTSSAPSQISNSVRADMNKITLECAQCHIQHRVKQDLSLRVVKTASPRQAHLGDVVRYTLQIENLGKTDWRGGSLIDTPARGLSYVPGSLRVSDEDRSGLLGPGRSPLRLNQIDIRAGHQATVTYLMRVGAGARAGMLRNSAQAVDGQGNRLSNAATADISLGHDPLLDRPLLVGTVFHDRDRDGWQDDASLSHVHFQGGFAPSAYIAQSTTLDRGDGAKPLADASAPLLHGIEIGTVPAAGANGPTRVVLHQRLRQLDFTNDFVMTSAQGWRLKMDALGIVQVEKSRDAAHGLTSAQPNLTRHAMLRADDTYDVDYVLTNTGLDETGLPGIRLATVDGMLVETDAQGRFHLAQDANPSPVWAPHNLLKLDPTTLPPAAHLTTENPLMRRMSNGMPTRFSFGVDLANAKAHPTDAFIAIGPHMFLTDQATIDPHYAPLVTQIAAKIAQQNGTTMIQLSAHPATLATDYGRAIALYRSIAAQSPATAKDKFVVQLRTDQRPGTPLISLDATGLVVGHALFASQQATLNDTWRPLLTAVAQQTGAVAHPVVRLQPLAPDQSLSTRSLQQQRVQQLIHTLRASTAHTGPMTLRVEVPFDPATSASSDQKAYP